MKLGVLERVQGEQVLKVRQAKRIGPPNIE